MTDISADEIHDELGLNFPCSFTIKAIGLMNEAFESVVLSTISKHAELKEGTLDYQYSKTKKYLAITIIIDAYSQNQLDAIYRTLSADPNVLLVL